ncbi:L-serine dehydratase 1 [mine drainage metagenome]|uniref:L-serine dehydratase 1 n=1 Tax=mine drainage metagenome TaxID=410659 RepID=T0Z898_9ZZZZ
MAVSVFDLFKIGIGPSSSHTVGPMRAAARFVERWLDDAGTLARVARVRVELYGSLALTGRGHGTDKAVMLGLEGHWPDQIDADQIPAILAHIRDTHRIQLGGTHTIDFDETRDLVFNKRQKLPYHVNGMRYSAWADDDTLLATRDYYSVGGGFVVNQDEAAENRIVADTTPLPYPFHSGAELLAHCARTGNSIAQLMLANECVWRSEAEVRAGLQKLWQAMQDCVARGLRSDGVLPAGSRCSAARQPWRANCARNPRPACAIRCRSSIG